MNPLLVDLAGAVDAERLRQARLVRPGRRMRAGASRTKRSDTRPVDRSIT
jgi:hypothetical protein